MRLRIEWETSGQDGRVAVDRRDIIRETDGQDLTIETVARVAVANLPAWLAEALMVALEAHEFRTGP